MLKHLENDIICLGKAIGKSYDEALIVVHLVLQDIISKNISLGNIMMKFLKPW